MFSTHPFSVVLLVGSLFLVPSASHWQDRCCTPPKLTGDVVYSAKTQFYAYVDFDNMVALEDYIGNQDINYRLYDMEQMIYYERETNGTCKIYQMTKPRYFQCVPSEARHVHMRDEDDMVLDGWRYYLDDRTRVFLVVRRDGCFPYILRSRIDHDTHQMVFINVVEGIQDTSVFQKNVTDCVDA